MRLLKNAFIIFIKFGGKLAVFSLLLMALEILTSVTQLYLLKWFVNIVSIYYKQPVVIIIALIFISIYFLENICSFFSSVCTAKSDRVFLLNFSKSLFDKFNKLDYSNYENPSSLNIISRLKDNVHDNVKNAINSCINLIKIFTSSAMGSLIVFEVSPFIGISYIITLLTASIFSILGMNELNKLKFNQTLDERRLNYYNQLLTQKNTIIELRVFKAINFLVFKINHLITKLTKVSIKRTFKASMLYNISSILITIWSVTTIMFCYKKTTQNILSTGTFLVTLKIIMSLMESIEKISSSFANTFKELQVIRYYEDFMNLKEKNSWPAPINLKHHADYSLKINNVSFAYPNNVTKWVLKDISLDIKNNEKVAFVGENGCGKSTLIKLICGLYHPTGGYIEVAENQIGIVFQDFCKYFLTVRENVALSNVKRINDYGLIMQTLRSVDFDTNNISINAHLGNLTRNSFNISEGQWQRLAICRAVFKEGDIFILDEPTAAIDPITEAKLYEMFLRISENKTCIIVSHRLAATKFVDRIFVIKDGGICEQGSHKTLINQNGEYAKMFFAQSTWYLDGAKLI